jgi:hypothetical protein
MHAGPMNRPASLLVLLALLALESPGIGAPLPADVASDRVLARLPVPAGWRLLRRGDQLVFERTAPVWVLPENRISAAASTETAAERSARIRTHGKQARPRFSFRLEPRWSAARDARVRRENIAVGRRLAALGSKHSIQRLLDQVAHSKNPDPLRLARTPDEERRIRAYLAERSALEAKLQPIPELSSGRFSLFPAGHEGWSDAYNVVDPPAAAEECYRVEQAIRDAIKAARP